MKSFKKFFSVIFVCVLLSLTVCSDYISCYNVRASGVLNDISNDLLYYFLSITGSISKKNPSNGLDSVINSISGSVRSSLLEEIDEQILNNGIYEDNGKIVFTSQAMEDLYYILNDDTNVDVRVVNDFSNFNLYGNASYSNYVNNDYLRIISEVITNKNNNNLPYIIEVYNFKYLDNGYDVYNTYFYLYTLDSNFSFISDTSDHRVYFYNNNSQQTRYPVVFYSCIYSTRDNRYYSSYNPNYNPSSFLNCSTSNYSSFFYDFPNVYGTYNTFPSYYTYYCTNSLLLSKNVSDATGVFNQSSGIFYFYNYNDISVEKNIITNNDWNSIYNSYVTNVSNTYNTEVTNNNGSDLTAKQIRQIMNTYLQPIYNAIDEGLTDIAEKVDYINEWLSKIYSNGSLIITRLDSIIQIIQQNTGGSGSTSGTACAWSDQEVDIVLDKLSRIYTEQVDNDLDVIAALEYIKTKISSLDTTLTTASSNISTISSNTSSIVTSLDTELSRLATVLTKMDTIISKMGQNRITQPTVDPNIIDDLEDLLPESVLDDIFSPFAALGSIIETVVPFCYIGVAVAIMSNLSAEAEAPYWEIPFKYDSDSLALHIDEKIVIDLSPFEDLSTILRLLFIIAFTISLMFFSLPLVNYMTGIFSGK